MRTNQPKIVVSILYLRYRSMLISNRQTLIWYKEIYNWNITYRYWNYSFRYDVSLPPMASNRVLVYTSDTVDQKYSLHTIRFVTIRKLWLMNFVKLATMGDLFNLNESKVVSVLMSKLLLTLVVVHLQGIHIFINPTIFSNSLFAYYCVSVKSGALKNVNLLEWLEL